MNNLIPNTSFTNIESRRCSIARKFFVDVSARFLRVLVSYWFVYWLMTLVLPGWKVKKLAMLNGTRRIRYHYYLVISTQIRQQTVPTSIPIKSDPIKFTTADFVDDSIDCWWFYFHFFYCYLCLLWNESYVNANVLNVRRK